MKKRICLWLCVMVLCVSWMHYPVSALDNSQPCSLTLHYSREGTAFSGLEIVLYRVAAFSDDGSYALTGAFSGYSVKIHDITTQKEWQEAAQTLRSYVFGDQISSTATAVTGEDGTVKFENLQTGLYLVVSQDAQTEEGLLRFREFLIFLPTPGQDGTFQYDLEAKPKHGDVIPQTAYSVIKLWKDSANPDARPQGITVDILKDGIRYETVVLNTENNWSYSWTTTDLDSVWSVVERDVPGDYTVVITNGDNVFTITNSLPPTPGTPPQTGDTIQIMPYALAMLLSGALILMLVFWRRRNVE